MTPEKGINWKVKKCLHYIKFLQWMKATISTSVILNIDILHELAFWNSRGLPIFFHILHFGALLENLGHNASRDFQSDAENEERVLLTI